MKRTRNTNRVSFKVGSRGVFGKITSVRRFKAGYVLCHEDCEQRPYGGKGFLDMTSCYAPAGWWIGSTREARFFVVKRGLSRMQKTSWRHCVCSIGFNENEQKWYGWSHRAICGFGIGDRIFEERYGNDETPFVSHGRRKIRTLKDAKRAACRFAGSVS